MHVPLGHVDWQPLFGVAWLGAGKASLLIRQNKSLGPHSHSAPQNSPSNAFFWEQPSDFNLRLRSSPHLWGWGEEEEACICVNFPEKKSFNKPLLFHPIFTRSCSFLLPLCLESLSGSPSRNGFYTHCSFRNWAAQLQDSFNMIPFASLLPEIHRSFSSADISSSPSSQVQLFPSVLLLSWWYSGKK